MRKLIAGIGAGLALLLLSGAVIHPQGVTLFNLLYRGRSVAAKLGDTVSVKDFGAVGDGVTDDRVAIAAACAAVGATGEVYAPTGTYRIATNGTCAAQIKLAKGASLSVVSGTIFTLTGTVINDNGLQNFNENAISLPSDFPATGVTFTRDAAGNYSSSFNPDTYAASWGITKTYFVNNVGGNDVNPGTSGQPFATFNKAIDTAIAGADTAVQITVVTLGVDVIFSRDQFTLASAVKTVSGKRIYVTPDDTTKRVYVANAQTGLSWTLNTGSTYQATRSAVSTILDMGVKDAFGLPKQYTLQTSIANVDANPGSWFTSGGIVYVRTLTGVIPTYPTILTPVDLSEMKYDLGASAEVFLRNVYFLGSNGTTTYLENVAGDYTATKFVAYNCAFANADPPSLATGGSNGLSIESIKSAQIYSSVAAYNSADGFNFHYTRADPAAGAVRNYYALVVNSNSYDNGINNLTGNQNINNAFTAHEGANFACVGCNGWNTQGPIFAFVNGVNSVLIGCKSRLSAHLVGNAATHAAYYFDQSSLPTGITGKVYMDDCEGNDTNLDLSTDGSALPITLRDFTGTKILSTALPNIRWLPSNALASRAQALQRTGAILQAAGTIPVPTQTVVGKGSGAITLAAGTGTAGVLSGSKCICTDTTANASVKCAVSTTTLTATGTASDVIAYLCF